MFNTNVSNLSLTLLTILAVLPIGCTEPPSFYPSNPFLIEFSVDTLMTHELQGELFIGDDSLGMPTDITVGERFVFIGDPYADQAITIFDHKTGDFIAHTAPKGIGANEIPQLASMNFKSGYDSGWIYAHPGILKFFDGVSLTGETIRLTGQGSPIDPVLVAEDSIVSSGIYETGRLGLYSPTGEFVKTLGQLLPEDPSIAMASHQYAYEAILKTNSTGTKIVAASVNTDRIEIFDTSKLMHLVRGPDFNEPEFSILDYDDNGNPHTFIEPATIQGYVSVAVTDLLIFALYSGKSRGWVRSEGYFSPPGHSVIVFTWTGAPVGILEIEEGALHIGVSQNGQYIYAIYRRPIPKVVRYETPTRYQSANSQ